MHTYLYKLLGVSVEKMALIMNLNEVNKRHFDFILSPRRAASQLLRIMKVLASLYLVDDLTERF